MDGHFRSLIYMRPLAIWGMQYALSLPKAILEAPKLNVMDRIHVSPMSWRPVSTHRKDVRPKSSGGCLGGSSAPFYCSCD